LGHSFVCVIVGLMNGDVILQDNLSTRWVRFSNPTEVVTATSLAEVRQKLEQVDQAVHRRGLHAAGFLAYEAAPAFDPAFQVNEPGELPLLWFGLYRRAEPVDMPDTGPAYTIDEWIPTVDRAGFGPALAQIKDYIAQGETYQVNYTMRLRANFSGDPWGLFVKLARSQQGGFSAFLDTGRHVICSASPEMFFQRTGLEVETQPMKGTATRGRTLAEDNANAKWLHNSAKNRAENVMIVDMIRNDLSTVADWGTVRVPHLFSVKRYPTILQMITTVTARTAVSSANLIAALFPCSSITGAPKVRTMEIIAELETGPRGVYTGCIGFMSPGRQAQFNVAIRTVCIDNKTGEAEYGVGSGIVWDSDITEEYEECRTKAKVLNVERPPFDLLETILWEAETGYIFVGFSLAATGRLGGIF